MGRTELGQDTFGTRQLVVSLTGASAIEGRSTAKIFNTEDDSVDYESRVPSF